ncbi:MULTISPECIES: hypothetical protein [unclassified Rhizobium]|uniref:hypothetical protein n=1 Tax=unclassified Rhizobium TaxID=2613769 RepID=UPI0012E3BBBC|nr:MULTISPECIES: hypothetical protein [unclassified Rhizobium]
MSIKDDAQSPLTEADAAPSKPGQKAAKPAGSKGGKPGKHRPQPNKPDPEEVQYPGYFKGQGSL